MNANNGIITQPSPYSVTETIDRLEAMLQAKGITIFARIDQRAEAKTGATKQCDRHLRFSFCLIPNKPNIYRRSNVY
jgi:uncharacterized protein (DUF302 family)